MRLKGVRISGFRGYANEVAIGLQDLTGFVGRNDAGKSSILDALGVFFDDPGCKIDARDACIHCGDGRVRITCTFDVLPEELVLDATASTSLEEEGLLNGEGELEIAKVIDCSLKTPKAQFYAVAEHPFDPDHGSLLLLKHADLKKLAEDCGVPREVNRSSNVELRRGIRAVKDYATTRQEIPLDKEDAKQVWDQISQHLPVYALFRADRASKDSDSEVQDPMSAAIDEALAEVQAKLDEIRETVRERAFDVAVRTIESLKTIDPALATGLNPVFAADPKWKGIFKLSIDDDAGIPLNKRGSGVRRLMLIAFFQAEAERRREASGRANIIYAVEEPEASQHPENQRKLMEALAALSHQSGVQVILTTHVPALAEMLPVTGVRHVTSDAVGLPEVLEGEDVLERVADELGVHPDSRVKVILCVEGPHDVTCLGHLSARIHEADRTLPDLTTARDVVMIPLGGSTLKDWVNRHYLASFRRPEVHIYDRDTDDPPKYQAAADAVTARGDGSIAFLTQKRELENYLHKDAVRDAIGVSVDIDDAVSVPGAVAEAVHAQSAPETPWSLLGEESRKRKVSRAKRRLNDEVASVMTVELLTARGAYAEVAEWLREVEVRRA